MSKIRAHDGIVGALITAGIGLGYGVDPLWLILPAAISLTMIQSALTGFCPVYFLLDKAMGPSDRAS